MVSVSKDSGAELFESARLARTKARDEALETLKNLGVSDVKLTIVDKGALDCTIKARIEAAVYRSVLQTEHLPWGGAIR